MSATWRPEGYSTVSPYLIVEGVEDVIGFLEETFRASELRRFDMSDGSIMHAEVRIGDSVVMMGEAGGEWTPQPCHIHVYVEDVDAACTRALEAGGELVQEPTRREGEQDRRGGVRGPGGNTWWIATRMEGA